jgi:hypothetical protein
MAPLESADQVNGVAELRSELRSLRGEIDRLNTRLQQVQDTLTKLAVGLLRDPSQRVDIDAERDAYRASLFALTRKDTSIRPEECVSGPAAAPSLEQFITELEQEAGQ